MVTGIPFAAGVYANTAATVTGAIKYAVLRCRLDAAPPTADGCLAGNSSFGADGFIFEAADASGHTGFGRLDVFGAGGYTAVYPHIPIAAELNRYVVMSCWLDTVAGVLRWFMDGAEIGKGLATGLTTLANGKFALNTRAGFTGTFQYGSWTFIEMAISTTEPTHAQVLTDALAAPGTAFAAGGDTHRWLASGSGAIGAVATSIPDSIGSQPLVIVGAPAANVAVPTRRLQGLGTVVLEGDSTTAGHSGGTDGDTHRKSFVQTVVGAGRSVALTGQATVANVTFDYDYRCSAAGGQALNQANGIIPSRMSTVATDRTSGISPTARLVLWYWLNDVAIRVLTNGDSAAVASAHMVSDVDAYVAAWRAVVSGPILVIDATRQTLAAAGSQTILDAAAIYTAQFASMIATLNGTYGSVYGKSFYYLDPADLSLFIDGTHPSVLCNETIIGPGIANALIATL